MAMLGFSLRRAGQRWGLLLTIPAILYVGMWLYSILMQPEYTGGPEWHVFAVFATWGLLWMVFAYKLRAEQHKPDNQADMPSTVRAKQEA
jgi:hypothetical protein